MSAGVPAADDDCFVLSEALSTLLTSGFSGADLLADSSTSSSRSGFALVGLCGSASPSFLTGSGVSDEGSVRFAMGLLAAAALPVFDSLHGNRCAKLWTANIPTRI